MGDIEKAEADKMLRQEVAVSSPPTDRSSPMVFSPKKDGTLRFCVDYRHLNSITIRAVYSIPRMDEYIDSPGMRRSSVP